VVPPPLHSTHQSGAHPPRQPYHRPPASVKAQRGTQKNSIGSPESSCQKVSSSSLTSSPKSSSVSVGVECQPCGRAFQGSSITPRTPRTPRTRCSSDTTQLGHGTPRARHTSGTAHLGHGTPRTRHTSGTTPRTRHTSDTTHLGHDTPRTRHTSDTTHLGHGTPRTRHTSDTAHLRHDTPWTRHTSDMTHLGHDTPRTRRVIVHVHTVARFRSRSPRMALTTLAMVGGRWEETVRLVWRQGHPPEAIAQGQRR